MGARRRRALKDDMVRKGVICSDLYEMVDFPMNLYKRSRIGLGAPVQLLRGLTRCPACYIQIVGRIGPSKSLTPLVEKVLSLFC